MKNYDAQAKQFDYIARAEDAHKMLDWVRTRDGIATWKSINLSNPTGSWTTPVKQANGEPTAKPNWQVENVPSVVITDPAKIGVAVDEEVKRFHVAIRRGAQGMSYKLTDVASRRLRREVDKAGAGAYFVFDYEYQDAIILRPVSVTPLLEYCDTHGDADADERKQA